MHGVNKQAVFFLDLPTEAGYSRWPPPRETAAKLVVSQRAHFLLGEGRVSHLLSEELRLSEDKNCVPCQDSGQRLFHSLMGVKTILSEVVGRRRLAAPSGSLL